MYHFLVIAVLPLPAPAVAAAAPAPLSGAPAAFVEDGADAAGASAASPASDGLPGVFGSLIASPLFQMVSFIAAPAASPG